MEIHALKSNAGARRSPPPSIATKEAHIRGAMQGSLSRAVSSGQVCSSLRPKPLSVSVSATLPCNGGGATVDTLRVEPRAGRGNASARPGAIMRDHERDGLESLIGVCVLSVDTLRLMGMCAGGGVCMDLTHGYTHAHALCRTRY